MKTKKTQKKTKKTRRKRRQRGGEIRSILDYIFKKPDLEEDADLKQIQALREISRRPEADEHDLTLTKLLNMVGNERLREHESLKVKDDKTITAKDAIDAAMSSNKLTFPEVYFNFAIAMKDDQKKICEDIIEKTNEVIINYQKKLEKDTKDEIRQLKEHFNLFYFPRTWHYIYSKSLFISTVDELYYRGWKDLETVFKSFFNTSRNYVTQLAEDTNYVNYVPPSNKAEIVKRYLKSLSERNIYLIELPFNHEMILTSINSNFYKYLIEYGLNMADIIIFLRHIAWYANEDWNNIHPGKERPFLRKNKRFYQELSTSIFYEFDPLLYLKPESLEEFRKRERSLKKIRNYILSIIRATSNFDLEKNPFDNISGYFYAFLSNLGLTDQSIHVYILFLSEQRMGIFEMFESIIKGTLARYEKTVSQDHLDSQIIPYDLGINPYYSLIMDLNFGVKYEPTNISNYENFLLYLGNLTGYPTSVENYEIEFDQRYIEPRPKRDAAVLSSRYIEGLLSKNPSPPFISIDKNKEHNLLVCVSQDFIIKLKKLYLSRPGDPYYRRYQFKDFMILYLKHIYYVQTGRDYQKLFNEDADFEQIVSSIKMHGDPMSFLNAQSRSDLIKLYEPKKYIRVLPGLNDVDTKIRKHFIKLIEKSDSMADVENPLRFVSAFFYNKLIDLNLTEDEILIYIRFLINIFDKSLKYRDDL